MERVIEFYADAARSRGHDVTVICRTKGDQPGRTLRSTDVVVERAASMGIVNSLPISPGLVAAKRRILPAAAAPVRIRDHFECSRVIDKLLTFYDDILA